MSDIQDIPAICDDCLGTNPYIEMIRDRQGAECKLCTRPFTTFEWQNTKRQRTIICLTCARSKNCCQVCMLDLTYGLDLQLRDSIWKLAGEQVDDTVPKNALTKAYKANQLDLHYKEDDKLERAKEILLKVSKSNLKPIQKPVEATVSKIEVSKIISKLPFNGNLNESTNLNSMFLFGITNELPEYLITNYFQKNYNTKIHSMSINHNAHVGFIKFNNQTQLSQVAKQILEKYLKETNRTHYDRPVPIVIDSTPLRICWGKIRDLGHSNNDHYKILSVVMRQMKLLLTRDLKS